MKNIHFLFICIFGCQADTLFTLLFLAKTKVNGSQLPKIKKKVDSLHAPAIKFIGYKQLHGLFLSNCILRIVIFVNL